MDDHYYLKQNILEKTNAIQTISKCKFSEKKRMLLGVIISVVMVSSVGCGYNSSFNVNKSPSQSPTSSPGASPFASKGDVKHLQVDNVVLPIVNHNGTNYVKAAQLVETLHFQSVWDAATSTYQMGDNDVVYEFTMNSKEARKEGDKVFLASEPVIIDQTAYIPVSTLYDLFQEDMSFEVMGQQLIIHGSTKNTDLIRMMDSSDDSIHSDQDLEFGDDPLDPFKNSGESTVFNSQSSGQSSGQSSAFNEGSAVFKGDSDSLPVVLRNISMSGLVSKARQYLGVGYQFGAGPYANTGKFDCSSYTQYVFGKFGVLLPRSTRDQANTGTYVSRKALRVGDLLFYYMPSRSRTNTTVGHVGIYLGNSQMINAGTVPIRGVQITNMGTAYWKRTYIRAMRVAY